MELRPLRRGSKVTAGTVLGRIGQTDKLAPHVNFAIQPSGKGAPQIDP
jgi:murein DD-endopeptidase MepM/ murein hydrolase activator NlpD